MCKCKCNFMSGRIGFNPYKGEKGDPGPPVPPGPPGDSSCSLQQSLVDVTCGGKFPCPNLSGNILTVGNGGTYATIQSAINASVAGDTVLISPGTYNEQVSIIGISNILITGTTAVNTIVETNIPGSNVFTIDNSQCIRIDKLTIKGPSTAFVGRTGRGIQVINNSSAIISNSIITMNTTNPITGVQAGTGINVDSGSSSIIVGNTVTEYQKTGIRINGTNTCATVANNTVTGIGPTPIIAQNGIQISRGATALVQNNICTNNSYTIAGTSSCGILLFQEPSNIPVMIQYNNCNNNDIGIGLSDTVGQTIQVNDFSNNYQYGTYADNTSKFNYFIKNTILNNGVFDIFDESMGISTTNVANFYLCNEYKTTNIITGDTPLSTDIILGMVASFTAVSVNINYD